MAAVQAVALYGSELWWCGQDGRAQKVQKLLNEPARRVNRCFKTTLQGALMNNAELRLAKAMLNNCVRHYKLRQMMMPDVVGKRLPPVSSHAFEWVRGWVRVIAALHHAINKVEKPLLDGIRHHNSDRDLTHHHLMSFLPPCFVF